MRLLAILPAGPLPPHPPLQALLACCVETYAAPLDVAGLVQRLRGEGLEVGGGQTLKSAPRGYPKDHPRIELLRYKGLICWQHWPVGPWLQTAQAKDRVTGFLRAAAPLHRWLDDNVGPGIRP